MTRLTIPSINMYSHSISRNDVALNVFMNSHCISRKWCWFHEFPPHQQEMLLLWIPSVISHSISRKCCFHEFQQHQQEISLGDIVWVENYFRSGLASRVPFHRASTPEILKPLLNGLQNLATYENCKISLKHYSYLLSLGGTGAVAWFQHLF